MIMNQAHAIVRDLLAPEPYDHFFEEVIGRTSFELLDRNPRRASILGDDPAATILGAFETHAEQLTCHTGKAESPPPTARRVASASEFHELIRNYHAAGYTVRIPDLSHISPELHRLVRALELLMLTPMKAPIFWSHAGAGAPIHQDQHDIIAIQVSGTKRWFLSTDPPTLCNTWGMIGETPPSMERYRTVDVAPGDLIYVPRGTPHTVQSTTESIHISIGFVPVTIRDAILAALDHVSDLDRPLRLGIVDRADAVPREDGYGETATRIRKGIEHLLDRCQSDSIIRMAMEHRTARTILDLPKLPRPEPGSIPAISPETRVRHTPLAISHVIVTPQNIDFTLPGSNILIHPGAEESIRFIAATPEFLVKEIAGPVGDDIRVALTKRLIERGFLEVVEQG